MIFDEKKYKFRTYLTEHMYRDQNNFLVCENAILGRSGFQKYLKKELGIADSNEVVEVLRPEEEVFKEDSMKSLEGRPLTKGHVIVTIDNYKVTSKGSVNNVHREENNLVGDITITDRETADLVESKKLKELSLGYSQTLKYDEDTDTYSFIDIIYNHIALVRKGRAGNAMILDDGEELDMELDENKVLDENQEQEEEPKAEDGCGKPTNDGCCKQTDDGCGKPTDDGCEKPVVDEPKEEPKAEEPKQENEDKEEKIVKDVAYFTAKQLEIEKITDTTIRESLKKALIEEMKANSITIDEMPAPIEPEVKPTMVIDEEEPTKPTLTHEQKMQIFLDKFNPRNYESYAEYRKSVNSLCCPEDLSRLAQREKLESH